MSTPAARANIRWVSAEHGGRQVPHPGPRYVTVVRFEGDEHWEKEAWSLIVEWDPTEESTSETVATVRFLMEAAPAHLLREGARFELLEGARKVADGLVLTDASVAEAE